MSLEELPVELLQAILKELRPRDLAVLSSISRPIYPVAMRELYMSITLKKKKQSRLLAKSFKHRRIFTVVASAFALQNSVERTMMPSKRCRILSSTWINSGISKSRQRKLTLLTDLQPIGGLVDFIAGRNPNLRELRLSPSALCGDKTPTLALPELEEFVGPSWCFGPHTVVMPLLQACIAWDLETSEEDTKDLIATLAMSCSGSLKVLCCSKAGLGLEISSSVIMDSVRRSLFLLRQSI